MFGDIATDLASVLQGGMGMAVGCNVGDHHGMFEPIHGSAPKHAGKGVVCPLATIAAAQMMLDNIGEKAAAARVEKAMAASLTQGEIRSLSTSSGMKTSEYTEVVLSHLE